MTVPQSKIRTNSSSNRRSTLERAITIFLFLSKDDQAKSKSDFREIGIDSTNVLSWIDLIQFIQRMPPLHVDRTEDRISNIHLRPTNSAFLNVINDYCTRFGLEFIL